MCVHVHEHSYLCKHFQNPERKDASEPEIYTDESHSVWVLWVPMDNTECSSLLIHLSSPLMANFYLNTICLINMRAPVVDDLDLMCLISFIFTSCSLMSVSGGVFYQSALYL